jgi:hypothetical protein
MEASTLGAALKGNQSTSLTRSLTHHFTTRMVVVDVEQRKLMRELRMKNVLDAEFSPKSNYLATFERHCMVKLALYTTVF